MARSKGLDEYRCETCGQVASGTKHLALLCPGLTQVRSAPEFRCKMDTSDFTRCTKIPETRFFCCPSTPFAPEPHTVLFKERASFFTDGSANQANPPNIRLSSWSVVHSDHMGRLTHISSGITRGLVHNILRAETFALYQVLRLANKPDVYVDNSTVVFYANEILTHGFHPSSWESRADGDLWPLIAAEMLSRPKDSIRVIKVKAHSSLEDAVDSFHQWLVARNAAADRWAKIALPTYVKENQLDSCAIPELTKIDDAFICSRLLHQISLHVRETVKEPTALDVHQNRPGGCPSEPSVENVQPWHFDKVAHFNSPTWDEKWLHLVQLLLPVAMARIGTTKPRSHLPGGNNVGSLPDFSDSSPG